MIRMIDQEGVSCLEVQQVHCLSGPTLACLSLIIINRSLTQTMDGTKMMMKLFL